MQGFKQFVLRGNVVDLAVGVVIGAAFNGVVSSFVKDLLTPVISAFTNGGSFADLAFTVHGVKFLYGDFLNSLISFLIVAAAVYFLVVLPVNKLLARLHPGETAPATRKCPECLSDIPREAKRCAHCAEPVR